jgi:hypothetical protein
MTNMETIIDVKPLDNFKVWIRFSDNFDAIVNIKPYISTGISKKLMDDDFFKRVKIDEFGGIVWENGFDFCPNYLREIATN